MVHKNLGKVDRVLRFALAFWWLGPWAPAFSISWLNGVVFAVGLIALVESMVGFCWLQHLLKIKTNE